MSRISASRMRLHRTLILPITETIIMLRPKEVLYTLSSNSNNGRHPSPPNQSTRQRSLLLRPPVQYTMIMAIDTCLITLHQSGTSGPAMPSRTCLILDLALAPRRCRTGRMVIYAFHLSDLKLLTISFTLTPRTRLLTPSQLTFLRFNQPEVIKYLQLRLHLHPHRHPLVIFHHSSVYLLLHRVEEASMPPLEEKSALTVTRLRHHFGVESQRLSNLYATRVDFIYNNVIGIDPESLSMQTKKTKKVRRKIKTTAGRSVVIVVPIALLFGDGAKRALSFATRVAYTRGYAAKTDRSL